MSRNVDPNKLSSNKRKLIKHGHHTARNSTATAFNWRTEMKDKDVSDIQRLCHNPLRMLGYNVMTNIRQNIYDNQFPLIAKTSKEIWPF